MTIDALAREVASHYTGAQPEQLRDDVLGIIEAAMLNQPRSLQKRIGPSEIGNPCDRCLAHKLGGTQESSEVAWLPYIGTAVHEALEGVFLRHELTRANLAMPPRFLVENRVTVGQIGDIDITGSTDLFDVHTGTVIDWKIVGTTTLKSVRAHGAKPQYRKQAHLYGKGWEDAGYTVKSVLVWFMPRNAISLRQGRTWQEPYDRTVAEAALEHANNLNTAIATFGLEHVLASLPGHITDDGEDSFSCRRFPDFAPAAAARLDPQNPFGS